MYFSFQPPKIGGVKVYTDNVRDQIMMDIEVLYVGKDRWDDEDKAFSSYLVMQVMHM